MKNARRLIAMLMSVFFLISLIPTIVLADVTDISNQYGVGVNRIILTSAKHPHITSNASVGGIGGKSIDDTAYVFTAGEIPEGATVYSGTAGAEYTGLTYNDYVFEANVYFDGGAEATVNYQYEETGYRLLHFKSDGTLEYNNNGTMTAYTSKFTPGQWHRVVVWFDAADGTSSRSRHNIYVDGIHITEMCPWMNSTQNQYKAIVSGIYAPTSENGIVAFDDFRLYYTGADYTPDENDAIVTNSSDSLVFDSETKTIKYDGSVYTSNDEIITAVKAATNATYANIMEDGTMVFTSPNGNTYSYWYVRSMNFEDSIFSKYYGDGAGFAVRGDRGYTNITYNGETNETLGGRVGTSYMITTTALPTIKTLTTNGMKYIPDTTKNHTFETSVYYEGNSYPAVNTMWDDDLAASNLLKVGEDGYVYYNNNGTTTKSSVQAKPGEWHRMVIEYQKGNGRYALYFDGILLTNNTKSYTAAQADEFWIGTASNSHSGRTAYADFVAYYSTYIPDEDDAIYTENSMDLSFDTNTKVISYNKYTYATTEALLDAVKAVAGCTYATVIGDDTLVFTSPSGKVYAYYKIKEMTDDDVMIGMIGLSSNSSLVYVLDSSVAVLSHALDRDYYTDSDEVISTLSSSKGYTLSYVDADKNELDGIDATVTDGYIKATKDENIFYIPVETKGKVNTDITKSPAGVSYVLDNDRSAYVKQSTTSNASIGGVSAEDIDYVITANNVPEDILNSQPDTVGFWYANLSSIPTTFEMSVFMTGDTDFAVNYGYEDNGYQILIIEDDGTVKYNYNSHGNLVTAPIKVEVGKWHKIAVVKDSYRNRYHLYVNGNLLTDKTLNASNATVMFGMGKDSTNGTVAIKDFKSYYGYYNYIDVVRAENGKIIASVDSDLLDGECFFALAEYADSEMVNLAPATITKANNKSVTLDFNAESTYRAFLWKNDASAPIATSVYYR